MIEARRWSATIGAVVALALAGFIASIPPASECSTPHGVHAWAAAPSFAVFLVLGSYVVAIASIAQRLALFVMSALVIAGFVAGLALSLPMVFDTEISCAAHGER